MKSFSFMAAVVAFVVPMLVLTGCAAGRSGSDGPSKHPKPTIVLVHGAFADASCWSKVIPILQNRGYTVAAVQNSLASLKDDIASTQRFVDAQQGSVVVVGHSYGGAVISGLQNSKGQIKALVYVAAFAPDSGEALGGLLKKYAPSKLEPALRPDAAGYVYIDRARFHEVFAQDVNTTEARVMAATQRPIFGGILAEAFPVTPSWRSIPTTYLVANQDNAINPELQRFFAARMEADTSSLDSSHVPFMSNPGAVADAIELGVTRKHL